MIAPEIQTFLMLALIATVPPLIVALIVFARNKWAEFRLANAQQYATELAVLDMIVAQAVQWAETAGVRKLIEQTGEAKLKEAVAFAEAELAKAGFGQMDLDELIKAIEVKVMDLYPPEDEEPAE